MFEYYGHQIIKKIVYGFGSLFNDIYLERRNSDNTTKERIKVPVSYGPKQKFIARANASNSDLTHNFESVLPRIGIEMNGIQYDASRKQSTTQRSAFVFSTTNELNYRYERVPYTLSFSVHVLCKNTEDALEIVEQILPYFSPEYTVSFSSIGVDSKIDVPISIGSTDFIEEYEGNFEERKIFIATINFTAKFYLYGPTSHTSIIKSTTTNFIDWDRIHSPTGSTLSIVSVSVTGGATAGNIGATGTISTIITEY